MYLFILSIFDEELPSRDICDTAKDTEHIMYVSSCIVKERRKCCCQFISLLMFYYY